MSNKIEQIDQNISEEALEFLAQKSVGDIRSLGVFLVCVLGRSSLQKRPIDIKLVEDVYQRLFKVIGKIGNEV